MKKYLILLLMGILPYLSLAQNKVENSYLSVTVPPGWHVQKQDMPGTKMELLNSSTMDPFSTTWASL